MLTEGQKCRKEGLKQSMTDRNKDALQYSDTKVTKKITYTDDHKEAYCEFTDCKLYNCSIIADNIEIKN